MKIKTSTLTGPALRYCVARAEGVELTLYRGEYVAEFDPDKRGGGPFYSHYRPDIDWGQGGPIIEREDICFDRLPDNGHRAFLRNSSTGAYGVIMDCWFTTKLETGMRCYVASQLGDEVDVPEGLLQDGDVIGRDADGGAICWSPETGPYNSGDTQPNHKGKS